MFVDQSVLIKKLYVFFNLGITGRSRTTHYPIMVLALSHPFKTTKLFI